MNTNQKQILVLGVLAVVSASLFAASFNPPSSETTASSPSAFVSDVTIDATPPTAEDAGGIIFEEGSKLGGFTGDTSTADILSRPQEAVKSGGGKLLLFAIVLLISFTMILLFLIYKYIIINIKDDRSPSSDKEIENLGFIFESQSEKFEPKNKNEIYKKWYKMVELLGLQQNKSLTPREIAQLAINNGIDKEKVKTLTSYFEMIRYSEIEEDFIQEKLTSEVKKER